MLKSLLLVLPTALLISAPVLATETMRHSMPVASGRSASPDAREAWFRQSVGYILEGRMSAAPKLEGRH